MKLQINIDTEFDTPADLLRAASAFVALAGERGSTAVGLPARGFTAEESAAVREAGVDENDNVAVRTAAKQTRAPRQQKAVEQPTLTATAEAKSEPTPAPTEQPAQTVATTRDDIKAHGTKVTQTHGAAAIAAVGDLFKSFVDADGNPARLSTVQEKDFPAVMTKLQAALAKPAGTPVDQLFA